MGHLNFSVYCMMRHWSRFQPQCILSVFFSWFVYLNGILSIWSLHWRLVMWPPPVKFPISLLMVQSGCNELRVRIVNVNPFLQVFSIHSQVCVCSNNGVIQLTGPQAICRDLDCHPAGYFGTIPCCCSGHSGRTPSCARCVLHVRALPRLESISCQYPARPPRFCWAIMISRWIIGSCCQSRRPLSVRKVGYFRVDPDSTPGKLIFNRTVASRIPGRTSSKYSR